MGEGSTEKGTGRLQKLIVLSFFCFWMALWHRRKAVDKKKKKEKWGGKQHNVHCLYFELI